jgi:hypothetical protein
MGTHRFTARERFSKKVRSEYIQDGDRETWRPIIESFNADVDLLIDVPALVRQLGDRAAKSKSGRATAMHGCIKVRLSNYSPVTAR